MSGVSTGKHDDGSLCISCNRYSLNDPHESYCKYNTVDGNEHEGLRAALRRAEQRELSALADIDEAVASAEFYKSVAVNLAAALKKHVGQFGGRYHHADECPGLRAHDGITVIGEVCLNCQISDHADAALKHAVDLKLA